MARTIHTLEKWMTGCRGANNELAIHVITPFSESAGNETVQRMQSMGRDELRVVLLIHEHEFVH